MHIQVQILLIFSYQHQLPWESERVTDAEKPRGFGEKGASRRQTPNLEQIGARKNAKNRAKWAKELTEVRTTERKFEPFCSKICMVCEQIVERKQLLAYVSG